MTRHAHRRVRTEPPAGSDPTPQRSEPGAEIEIELAGEDRLGAWGDDGFDVLPDQGATSNASRLEADRPPHYA